ncbi:nucleotidyltransferase domain-containing protein [Thermoanaerobacterium thermosaccharolyticum]|uniref:Nucleotidyltransferase family protein n=1 Tax=Thermoanaerobacterium thermosaccharolyticum M0795 TaxID=698948 RepID=L0IMR7_THETR|nr:nucleotidyltransferase domain-containing protein [Thermoanaerobacterium thermosaccharolyticum]AGB19526.1 nucleotidyltransferase family protein [Thermoanaerobacterium thermosaccharolyticum M0795]
MNAAMIIREIKRNNLIDIGKKYWEIISNVLYPMCAIIIGSVARGDFNDNSDIDVIIISDKVPVNYKERMKLLYDHVFDAIEPKGYNTEEFKLLYFKKNPISVEAIEKGIVIHDDKIWDKLKKDILSKQLREL